jgi:transposase-like protein
LAPLLHGAPLSRSAVSRIVATLKSSLAVWQTRPLGDLEVVYAYLDALISTCALRFERPTRLEVG